jgi:hypothetical protein
MSHKQRYDTNVASKLRCIQVWSDTAHAAFTLQNDRDVTRALVNAICESAQEIAVLLREKENES